MVMLYPILAVANEVSKPYGVIAVLEAPLFDAPSETAFVVWHYRKGDVVHLHPAEFSELNTQNENLDFTVFAEDNIYVKDDQSPFYKTTDRTGRDAYILKTDS